MAENKYIDELTEIAESAVDVDADWMVLEDVSASETKKIKYNAVKPSHTYLISASATDHGAAGAGSLLTVLTALGTTTKATVYFAHDPTAGATTTYTVSTTYDASAYTNISFVFENGALLSVATGVTLTLPAPANVVAGVHQRIASGSGTLAFGASTGFQPAEWSGSTGGMTFSTSSLGLIMSMDQAAVAMTEGLTLMNTNASNTSSPVLQFVNSDTSFSNYKTALFGFANSLILRGTDDNWATAKTVLSGSQDNFTVTSNTNAGYFQLTQTHTSSDGSIAGSVKQWVFQDDDMSSDATVQLPDAVNGLLLLNVVTVALDAHSYGLFFILADGSVKEFYGSTNATIVQGTGSGVNVYESGNRAIIENKLGAAVKIMAIFYYI